MALADLVSKLNVSESSDKPELYTNIAKSLQENAEISELPSSLIKDLLSKTLSDLKEETTDCPHLVKVVLHVFQSKALEKTFIEEDRISTMKSIFNLIEPSQNEFVIVNCFSILIQLLPIIKFEENMLTEILQRMDEVLSKKKYEAVSAYYTICSYFQKLIKEHEQKLSNYIPLLSKLVFLPLCHPSSKVREVAEKTLDSFPKLLLYAPHEEATTYLLKLIKEVYAKNLAVLFNNKHELYVLKVLKHVVNALGSTLSANVNAINAFFPIIEKGFKSPSDEICVASFGVWKCLISSFAFVEGTLNESKKLRFILKPLKNISRFSESILSAACDTWWHLVWNLSENLSSRFTEVCIPLLELIVGKITNGYPDKQASKNGQSVLIKKCCFILMRFLEQPPSPSFNRLCSPKKLPQNLYPALQVPILTKVLAHNFKEILQSFKTIIEHCNNKEEMRCYLDCIMKSLVFIVSNLVEDSSKDSIEAVSLYLQFLNDIIETKIYPSILCLKCLESLSKLSRRTLLSHCFSYGSRTSQDIFCISLLKLLLNPHVFSNDASKRIFITYNRLVQAGISELHYPLQVFQKFIQIIKSAITPNSIDADVLLEMWCGIVSQLLETVEKTQEVNQGDKQDHDFSCMYEVLLFPFEFIFPLSTHQFRTTHGFKLWKNLFKAFVRCASLVPSVVTNEVCEMFCIKLKGCIQDQLEKPHFFESICLLLQVIVESIDFSPGTTGLPDSSLILKRKKSLGNLSAFIDLLSLILKSYCFYFSDVEADTSQVCSPSIQKTLQTVKNAAPVDLLKSFFGSIKSNGIILYALEQLAEPFSKLFPKSSVKKNIASHIDPKLEMAWNTITVTIERYYLGPYDTDFLSVMSPVLEATFSHPKRNMKEKSRKFWFATFGPNTSKLKIPESLKTVLLKAKLPLISDEISPVEFSITPLSDSVEDSIDVAVPALSTVLESSPVQKAFDIVAPVLTDSPKVNKPVQKAFDVVVPVLTDSPKVNKPSPKVSIDDLPNEEFVKIDSVFPNPRRKSIRKRKSFIPSMYNDLSQDTNSMMNSLDSQDTADSASLDDVTVLMNPAVTDEKLENNEEKNTEENEKDMADAATENPPNTKDTGTSHSVNIPMLPAAEENQKIDIPLSSENASVKSVDEKIANQTLLSSSKVSSECKTLASDDKLSIFAKPHDYQIFRKPKPFSRLSNSFSGISEKEVVENKKMNASCIEFIDLTEDIIPSSQDTGINMIKSPTITEHFHIKKESLNVDTLDKSNDQAFQMNDAANREKSSADILKDECHSAAVSASKEIIPDSPLVNDDSIGINAESKNIELNNESIAKSKLTDSIDKVASGAKREHIQEENEVKENCDNHSTKNKNILEQAEQFCRNEVYTRKLRKKVNKGALASTSSLKLKRKKCSDDKSETCDSDHPSDLTNLKKIKCTENTKNKMSSCTNNESPVIDIEDDLKQKKCMENLVNINSNCTDKEININSSYTGDEIVRDIYPKSKIESITCAIGNADKPTKNVQADDNIEIAPEVPMQNFENTESCEIFESQESSSKVLDNDLRSIVKNIVNKTLEQNDFDMDADSISICLDSEKKILPRTEIDERSVVEESQLDSCQVELESTEPFVNDISNTDNLNQFAAEKAASQDEVTSSSANLILEDLEKSDSVHILSNGEKTVTNVSLEWEASKLSDDSTAAKLNNLSDPRNEESVSEISSELNLTPLEDNLIIKNAELKDREDTSQVVDDLNMKTECHEVDLSIQVFKNCHKEQNFYDKDEQVFECDKLQSFEMPTRSLSVINCDTKQLRQSTTDTLDDIVLTVMSDLLSMVVQDSDEPLAVSEKYNDSMNKENKIATTSARGSKKRKIKPPLRSPINFRQRFKSDNAKKLATQHVKLQSVGPEQKALGNKAVAISRTSNGCLESSMTEIISSLVDTIAKDEMIIEDDVHPNITLPSHFSKVHKLELSNDELTDLNTRLNASAAPQTRRSKLIASQTSCDVEEVSPEVCEVQVADENAMNSSLSSILKKRKNAGSSPPSKVRKVTFASPLIQELLVENYSDTKGVLTIKTLQPKKKRKIIQSRTKVLSQDQSDKVNPDTSNDDELDDSPSSLEYQDSDVVDFCDMPVSPSLVNCEDDVSNIIKDLTSPSWVRGLESLLVSKNIKTVGDVCKLNIHQLKALPFKSPKVITLHKAVIQHINNSQESMLEKFKTINDESFDTDIPASSGSKELLNAEEKEKDSVDSELIENTVQELLKNNRLDELPSSLLGQLANTITNIFIQRSKI